MDAMKGTRNSTTTTNYKLPNLTSRLQNKALKKSLQIYSKTPSRLLLGQSEIAYLNIASRLLNDHLKDTSGTS